MSHLHRALADVEPPAGLRLVVASDRERDQIIELMASEIDLEAGDEVRCVLDDSGLGPDCFALAMEGDEVVAAAGRLPGMARLGDVEFPYGQIEFVATSPRHRRRGLMRVLVGACERATDAAGGVVHLIGGVEYVYRRVGYEYAIPLPRVYWADGPLEADPGPWGFVQADGDLLDRVAGMQWDRQRAAGLAVPPLAGHYRRVAGLPGCGYLVAVDGDRMGAAARFYRHPGGIEVSEVCVGESAALTAMVAQLSTTAPRIEVEVRDADASGLPAGMQPRVGREALYVKVTRPAALFDRLRPLFLERLAAAGSTPRTVVLDRYVDSLSIDVSGVASGDRMSDPATLRIPPDRLAGLLFGEHGLVGLEEIYPDVVVVDESHRPLLDALFPPVTSDVVRF